MCIETQRPVHGNSHDIAFFGKQLGKFTASGSTAGKLAGIQEFDYEIGLDVLKWLRMLMNDIPDKYEHLVRDYGYYSNRSRGARRLVEYGKDAAESIRIDEPPADNRSKANRSRLIQKVYEVDPLKCTRCGATLRIIARIDDAGVIERILKHRSVRDPQPETRSPAGPDPLSPSQIRAIAGTSQMYPARPRQSSEEESL